MRTTEQYDELVKLYREAAVFFASHMPTRLDGLTDVGRYRTT